MAYDRRKIISFGVGGVAIAVILILAFLPVRIEVGINPTVALQEISGYGFQIVKISEEQANVVHLNVTLDRFEIRQTDGDLDPHHYYGFYEIYPRKRRSVVHWCNLIPESEENQGD